MGFTDDYVLQLNLQVLKPLGADKIAARDYFHNIQRNEKQVY